MCMIKQSLKDCNTSKASVILDRQVRLWLWNNGMHGISSDRKISAQRFMWIRLLPQCREIKSPHLLPQCREKLYLLSQNIAGKDNKRIHLDIGKVWGASAPVLLQRPMQQLFTAALCQHSLIKAININE